MNEDPEAIASTRLKEAFESLEKLNDESRGRVLGEHLERLVTTAAPGYTTGDIYRYLLQHKHGLTWLARLRYAIQLRYSVPGRSEGEVLYLSPSVQQWFEDGVMFSQGAERFAGLVGLFQNGRLKFCVAARSAHEGDVLTKEDFVFIDVEDLQNRPPQGLSSESLSRAAIKELRDLLASTQRKESLYQDLFKRFPWIFGAQYISIQSHEALDDANIPDFTGVRSRDNARDVLEIKDPFLPLFRATGKLASAFNDAWNQCERYLDFCRHEADYLLRQKGLYFENPHCYLVMGHHLSHDQFQRLRAKERMNPSITVLTYDDVLVLAENTVAFYERHFDALDKRA